jgi:hypothetical protein
MDIFDSLLLPGASHILAGTPHHWTHTLSGTPYSETSQTLLLLEEVAGPEESICIHGSFSLNDIQQ